MDRESAHGVHIAMERTAGFRIRKSPRPAPSRIAGSTPASVRPPSTISAGKQPDFQPDGIGIVPACLAAPSSVSAPLLELLLKMLPCRRRSSLHTHARLLYITDRLGVTAVRGAACPFPPPALGNSGEPGQVAKRTITGKTTTGVPHRRRLTDLSLIPCWGYNAKPAPTRSNWHRRLLKQHHPDKLAGRNVFAGPSWRATEKPAN